MTREQTINQLKRAWIQFEIAKREKTNELWMIEAQIEKIKSKIKSYGMDKDLELDQELVAVWESAGIGGSSSSSCSNVIRDNRM
jgi:hypothetical protein